MKISSQRSRTARGDYDVTAAVLIGLALTYVCTATQGPDLAVSDASTSVLGTELTTLLIINESSTATPSTPHVTTLSVATSSLQSTPRPDLATDHSLGRTEGVTESITEKQSRDPSAPDVQQTTESIVTEDFSHMLGNDTHVTGSSDHKEKDNALQIEFLVIIISTVLVIVALVIVLAALVLWCCQRRSQRPSPFVKFKKTNAKYDKMDLELGNTIPRNDSGGREWIFSTGDVVDDHESIDLNLRSTQLTNDNYDPEENDNIEIAPSISDYHSESNHVLVATLELEDDDNDLNVNPMYSVGLSESRGSVKDSGINGSGSDDQYDVDMSVRSDLQSFADETVEL